MKSLSALAAGLLFGLGLIVAEMVNPAKVLNFLDLFGRWDPSLAYVMGGALATTFIGYRIVFALKAPFFEEAFDVPTSRALDARLLCGAALFGIGWGLAGLCPGPAITVATSGGPAILAFLAAMVGASVITRMVMRP